MSSLDRTMQFHFPEDPINQEVQKVLQEVFLALEEMGYNPINQIVGYLLSGDHAYNPRNKDARKIIRKLERDEIIEELVKFYIQEHREEK